MDFEAIARGAVKATDALARWREGEGATRGSPKPYFIESIRCYVYAGDTALHIAAAAHQVTLVKGLIGHGADVHARNRRGAEPLHYAANGGPHLDDGLQAKTVSALIEAGADPNATDKSGVAPLHRAVRNRCPAAVRALLEGGADRRKKNGNGSTPSDLAKWTTGKSGSGSDRAHAAQVEIAKLLARDR